MTIVFDILHLAVAAVLAIIGIEYEREPDCPPVRFESAAHAESHAETFKPAPVDPQADAAALVYAADCEGDGRAMRFPAL